MKARRPITDSTGKPFSYVVADAETLQGLEDEVNKALNNGYETRGGVVHSFTKMGHELYAQALQLSDKSTGKPR